jgi:hypothetical protein
MVSFGFATKTLGVGSINDISVQKPLLKYRYLSNDSSPRGSWPFIAYFSAALLLVLYFFFTGVFIFLLFNAIRIPSSNNMPILLLSGMVVLAINVVMLDFPLRLVSIVLTEENIIFRTDDRGFMIFGFKTKYSLCEPLGVNISRSQGYLIFSQEGRKEHVLNIKGLKRNVLDSLLANLGQNKNVKMDITK